MPVAITRGPLLATRVEVGDRRDGTGGEGEMVRILKQGDHSGSDVFLIGIADAQTAGDKPSLHGAGSKRGSQIRDLRHVLTGHCPVR